MITYNQKLGNIIKTYRKSKSISTQELAKTLNVSVGCISHIENAKNNVFKLDLLFNLIKELDIPISEILLDNSLILDALTLNQTKDKIEISLKAADVKHSDLLAENIKLIINAYLEIASECSYDSKTINIVSSHILNELKYSKSLIDIKK
jgi:transcriptional regulator with XRE-family HTH domain